MQKSGKIRAWAGRLGWLDSGTMLRRGLAATAADGTRLRGSDARRK